MLCRSKCFREKHPSRRNVRHPGVLMGAMERSVYMAVGGDPISGGRGWEGFEDLRRVIVVREGGGRGRLMFHMR